MRWRTGIKAPKPPCTRAPSAIHSSGVSARADAHVAATANVAPTMAETNFRIALHSKAVRELVILVLAAWEAAGKSRVPPIRRYIAFAAIERAASMTERIAGVGSPTVTR